LQLASFDDEAVLFMARHRRQEGAPHETLRRAEDRALPVPA
jgi:hypothetical protein